MSMTNERLKDLLDILGINLITNHGMATDEILDTLGCTVDDEGEIIDEDGKRTGVWYEEIEY